ncbi:MAG: helix-turn-helix transcriptional regulator [Robiginitomaculum sp.]|nr:helix-turn-helix transcriptional regulator [Robiginitomaculum sp.]
MSVALEYISLALKEARQEKGLSQRALSTITGLPQSHLSKIERGETNLTTKSLIELARALDLELVLVPKQLMPALKALKDSDNEKPSSYGSRSAYRLDGGG